MLPKISPTVRFPSSSFVSLGRTLRHPLWMGALVVLLVNDHLLKGSGVLPSWLTGKLSDVAGLLMAPALLGWLLRVHSRRGWLAAHAAVGVVFALLEWSPAARLAEAASTWVGLSWRLTCDATDLLALPMLAASYLLGARTARAPRAQASSRAPAKGLSRAELLLGATGLVASVATSQQRPPVIESPAQQRVEGVRGGGISGMTRVVVTAQRSVVLGDDVYVTGVSRIEDLATGRQRSLSIRELPGVAETAPLAVSRGVYLMGRLDDSDPELVAVDARSGQVLWTEDEAYEAPLATASTFVFAQPGELVARDAHSGEVVWRHAQNVPVLRWATANESIFVIDRADDIQVLDASTGRLDRAFRAPGHADVWSMTSSTFAATAGMVAVMTHEGLRVSDVPGEEQWGQTFPVRTWATGALRVQREGATPAQVVASNGVIVLWKQGQSLQGLEARSGRVLWSRPDHGVRKIAAESGKLLLTSDRTAILDIASGADLATYNPADKTLTRFSPISAVVAR